MELSNSPNIPFFLYAPSQGTRHHVTCSKKNRLNDFFNNNTDENIFKLDDYRLVEIF